MTRCLVVGAAPSDHGALDYLLDELSFDAVLAVDGGYATLKERGIALQAVFGDFDSLGYVPGASDVLEVSDASRGSDASGASDLSDQVSVFAYDTHKDFTDLDLALEYAQDQAFDEVVVCDALVGRLDHTLGNLQLLIKYARRGMCIWGTTEDQIVTPMVAPGPFSSLVFDASAAGVVSVVSHSDTAHGVTEEGLEYGVQDATCFNAVLWGVSNEFIGKPSRISLCEGSLWVLFPLEAVHAFSYGG